MRLCTIVAILCLAVPSSATAAATLLIPYFEVACESVVDLQSEDPPGCVADLLRGGSSPVSCTYRVESIGQGQRLGQAGIVEDCEVHGAPVHDPAAGFTVHKVGCAVELIAADGSKITGRSIGDLLVLDEGRGQQTSSFIQLGGTGRFSSGLGGGTSQRIMVSDTDPAEPSTTPSTYSFYGRYTRTRNSSR